MSSIVKLGISCRNARPWLATLLAILLLAAPVQAREIKQVSTSPLSGLAFNDKPIMLPTQRNFQMAMLTASSELARSCGRMESYGWRLAQTEQQRVNTVFNDAVDWFRGQGFTVESQSANSVASDVTMFTADREDKHFLTLWSAGELGLVMVMCETSAPLPILGIGQGTVQSQELAPAAPSPVFNSRYRNMPEILARGHKESFADFSPIGTWVGSYSCYQGTTGGTLRITQLKGDHFKGSFEFYPTPKNPYVPSGSYEAYGQYDADTGRILINPGKWIKQPHDYYNTIMIGSFDPVTKTFSGYFQGITGCTSFEARRGVADNRLASATSDKPAKPKKKTTAKKPKPKAEPAVVQTPAEATPTQAVPVAPEPTSAVAPAAAVAPATPETSAAPPVVETPAAAAVPAIVTPEPPAAAVLPTAQPSVAPAPVAEPSTTDGINLGGQTATPTPEAPKQ